MKKLLVVAAAAFAALVTSSAFAADVYLVEENPNAEAPYDTWEKAATTLADALASLGSGMTLHVRNGTYAITGAFTLDSGKAIVSENGPEKTIFQSKSFSTPAITVKGEGSRLSGVTVKGLTAPGNKFGGVELYSGGEISNCAFLNASHGNAAPGTMRMYGGLLADCLFQNSQRGSGAGATSSTALSISAGTMERCRVIDSWGDGGSVKYGAVYVYGTGVVRNTVVAGSCQPGYTGFYLGGSGRVESCTVANNESTSTSQNAAVYIASLTASVSNTVVVGNCDVFGARTGIDGIEGFEACVTDCYTAEDVDPRFQAAIGGDYRLLPDSPCIRSDGTTYGAYGFELPSGTGAAVFRRLIGDWRFAPQTNELSAVITPDGATCDPATCYWTFDGTEPSAANHQAVGLTVTNAFGVGSATVRFRATVDGEAVAVDKADWFDVKNGYVYVDKNSANPQAPYSTWETAAKTHGDGCSALQAHMVMVMADGSYKLTVNQQLTPPRYTTIRSVNGPEKVTILPFNGNAGRAFNLTYPKNRIEGITFTGNGRASPLAIEAAANATVSNCIFKDLANSVLASPALPAASGRIVDCLFKNSAGVPSTGLPVVLNATGQTVVDRCVFDGNVKGIDAGKTYCGIISVSGGAVVRNSLFINNSMPVYSAIYVGADGTAENCTVVKNTTKIAKADNADASAVYAADPSAKVVNVLAVGNMDVTGGVAANMAAASGAEDCFTTCREADSVTDGNIKFADPTADDFSLQAKSVCVNAGTTLDWMDGALDLAGNPRVRAEKVDIGAYEYTPSGEVGVTLSFQSLDGRKFAPSKYEFAAEVTPEGAECDPATCYWTFDGREPTAQDHDATGLAVTNTLGVGTVTVRFRATVNGQAVAADQEDWFTMRNEFVYVNAANTTPESPYDMWEKAAKNITEAFAVFSESMTMLVTNGTYVGGRSGMTLPQNATVRSLNGPSVTRINKFPENNCGRIFNLSNFGATLTGFTISSGDTAGALSMSGMGAVISNCVCRDIGMTWTTVLSATGGTVVDCVFTNCTGCESYEDMGIAVTASGANTLIDRCVFNGNYYRTVTSKKRAHGAVRVSGGATVRNSLFTDNTAPFFPAIWVGADSHAENCTVVRNASIQTNSVDSDVGAVYAADATASVVNVLTVGNTDGEDATANASGEAGAFDHCFTEGDPLFRDPEKSNFRLKSVSPCLNRGAVLPWMADATDLDGNPRIRQSKPDLGCYEGLLKGLTILVR